MFTVISQQTFDEIQIDAAVAHIIDEGRIMEDE